jgi:hypothetical protein
MPFNEEKQIQQLVSLYRLGFQEIIRIIVEKEAKGQWTDYYRDTMVQIQGVLQQLDKHAAEWISKAISQVYSQAAVDTASFLMAVKLGRAVQVNPSFSKINQRALDVIAQNMADNLFSAHQYVGRRVNDVFRQVGLEQTGRKLATGATIRDMKQQVIQRLLDQGLTGFKDRLGRQWRLDSYAEMVARTTTREAASVAMINQCLEYGHDLVRISTHYPTCHLCSPLQGKVFSISGNDKRYPKLEDEYRPPIHPRCRHVLTPYVRELDPDAEKTERHSNTSLTEDPRTEDEKRAYKETQDAATIKRNRRRAREVLYNPSAQLEDKVKAAKALNKTYEKTGTKPVGKDAQILKYYRSND